MPRSAVNKCFFAFVDRGYMERSMLFALSALLLKYKIQKKHSHLRSDGYDCTEMLTLNLRIENC